MHAFRRPLANVFARSLVLHVLAIACLFLNAPTEINRPAVVATVRIDLAAAAIPPGPKTVRTSPKKTKPPAVPNPLLDPNPPDSTTGTDSSSSKGESFVTGLAAQAASARTAYTEDLRAAIEREKKYPPLAKSRRQTGRLEIDFVILRDGTLTEIHLREPGPFSLLNEEAVQTVQRVKKFRPFPAELPDGALHLAVAIDFRLE